MVDGQADEFHYQQRDAIEQNLTSQKMGNNAVTREENRR